MLGKQYHIPNKLRMNYNIQIYSSKNIYLVQVYKYKQNYMICMNYFSQKNMLDTKNRILNK